MWPLTANQPKSLLSINGKPVVEYIIDTIRDAGVNNILISTNLRFRDSFRAWLSQSRLSDVDILAEASTAEANKLGAVRALARLRKRLPQDDYLIMAGDNIITTSLSPMIDFYKRNGKPIVAVFRPRDSAQLQSGSSVFLDRNNRIKAFEEKPNRNSRGRLGALIYILPYATFARIDEYLAEKQNDADAPGYFVAWLCMKEPVYGFTLPGRLLDIGNMVEFERASKELNKNG